MRDSNADIVADAMGTSAPPGTGHDQNSGREGNAQTSVEGGLIPVDLEDIKHYTIILMGLTGTGKSSFISLLKGRDIGIGHDLESCTSRSREYDFQLDSNRVVHLIDTPGFNDTTSKDSDILREIAFFLNKIYEERIEVNGVIFLHRITDQRMSGASLRNLHILQKMCGESAIPHIVLASTMWGNLEDTALGISREKDLLQNANFWAPLQTAGAIIARHDGSEGSAKGIVEALIRRGTTVLDIQLQMVDQQYTLDQTTVGQYLQEEMLQAKKKHEKELTELEEALKEAVEDNDQSLIQILTAQRQTQVELLSQSKVDQKELQVSSKSLDLERSNILTQLKNELVEDERKREDEICALRTQIEALQDDLVDTQVGRSRDMSRALKDRENLIVHNKRLEHSAMMQQQDSENLRRALHAQLARKEMELQAQRRRERSSGIGSFFRELFAYNYDDHDNRPGHGQRHGSFSDRHHPQKLQRRSTAPHYGMSERTFRSNDMAWERRYN